MTAMNENYLKLKESYLFAEIAKKVSAYERLNPEKHIFRMGIGDVSLPLCNAVIKALHRAVDDQSKKESFHGYMPECGAGFLREAVADHYRKRGIELSTEEIFISSGASDELGAIIDLFDRRAKALVQEPAYPAYVDANIMAGREIIHLSTGKETGFLADPENEPEADIIYICSPNNPTGAVYSKELLRKWVDFANRRGAVIIFDAAYEAFIEEEELPRSIFEIEGAENCAIEICSFSKTAGFTGTRLGYTVIPKALSRGGMNLNSMWVRNRTTKTNGVSYIIQRGGEAVFSSEGQEEIRENIKVYKDNAKVIMEALNECNIRYFGGKNAPYIWMECPDSMKSREFFDFLLYKAQIVGTPGIGFGACGENFFRLSSFADPRETEEAAVRLRSVLK
ncbi:MAG: LL-diaminopimelate aminotransferase [Candidatus Avilachnospira sp.]|jgi:LL-diaminopimelate aminotransferase